MVGDEISLNPIIDVSSSDEIWSHPDTPLIQHLLETAENTRILLSEINSPKFQLDYNLNSSLLRDLAIVISSLHDIGKSTGYFQKYIRNEGYKNNPKKNHANLGMLYIFWFLYSTEFLESYTHNQLQKIFIAFVSSIIINRHHGNLKELPTEKKHLRAGFQSLAEQSENNILKLQLESTRSHTAHIDKILSDLSVYLTKQIGKTILLPKWTTFINLSNAQFSDLYKVGTKITKAGDSFKRLCEDRQSKKDNSFTNFPFNSIMIIQFWYSLLQESDKTSAMTEEIIQRVSIDLNNLFQKNYFKKFTLTSPLESNEKSNYVDTSNYSPPRIKESSLSSIRTTRPKIYSEVAKYANFCDLSTRIYSLEAPTGSGKTLSGMNFALTLRQRLLEIKNSKYRIIYILPFTSILEQTHSVMKRMLGVINDSSNVLLKHHGDADLKFSRQEFSDIPTSFALDEDPSTVSRNEEEEEPNVSAFYIEGWNSEIIITTFHQFFHSVFTNNKKNLRKYSKFSNSIIIMDEVQGFPLRYWNLFDRFIPKFLDFLDSYLLFSTATLPGILTINPPIVSKSASSLFQKLNRTSVKFIDQEIQPENLIQVLHQQNVFDSIQSFLIVLNTINSSQIVYRSVSSDPFFDDWEKYYLSASITPKERKNRIDTIKSKLKGKEKVVLVSTQVIEAGVDISFQAGVRDISTMDSIIQTIGRINREGEIGQGICYVTKLINQKKRLLASFVYDKELLNFTIKILQENSPINEKSYRKLVRNYFELAKEYKSTKTSRDLYTYICKTDFNNVEAKFNLIENDYSVPLYVTKDNKAKDLLEEYREIAIIRPSDWKEARNQYYRIKPQMAEYLINTSIRKIAMISTDLEQEKWFWILPMEQIQNYYDQTIGFTTNLPGSEELVW